jgi:vacuolar-type H+-ATPase subunit I/STV1
MKNEQEINIRSLLLQSFIGIAAWMSFGLLLEGFIGFRVSGYMSVPIRREMFQLAHTHGTLLSLLLLVSTLTISKELVYPNKFATLSLRIGTILMPLGFLLGGIQPNKDEPNALVFLAPIGGILVIFGIINFAFSIKK